ncbi:hypothetical protein SAMN05421770_10556 [Granulicella rosea]|uniref:Uncharacterized protein n=1 Tax=Granulicella rosea TaxID=474952 RepID=A0A239KPM8_9BACT|nr:hypothetical protein [Granulicella rosea]SNT19033.1 hypothetical protein SAMN05421770_10549 [Granulicella rosea]SNT19124.1 hypothetical protein SAMN05421770_10556 [Granulicella rosea]
MIWDGRERASDTNGSHPDLVLAQTLVYEVAMEEKLKQEVEAATKRSQVAEKAKHDAAMEGRVYTPPEKQKGVTA